MTISAPFVDLPAAVAARGLRLVVVGGIPSPWSEAAKALFRVKGVPHVLLRFLPSEQAAIKAWTGSRNAPVAMYEEEPPRTGWTDILELAERLGPGVPLVPADPEERSRMFGLAHELMGEGAVTWSARLMLIHEGLRTEGARGFPPRVATYLAARYGYAAERIEVARARVASGLALLGRALGDAPYYLGGRLTALDLFSAAAMNVFAPMPEALSPMLPAMRAAFESMSGDHDVPPALIAHRQRVYEEHMGLPIVIAGPA